MTLSISNPINEICLACDKDTSYGSGKFINRIPHGWCEEEGQGWLCEECQLVECHKCNDSIIDYECVDGGVICRDCFEDIGSDIVVMFIDDIIKKYADYFGFKHGSVKAEYDGDFLELLELLRGVTYVESRGNGWAVQQGFEKQ